MGNPHLIIFVDELTSIPLDIYGPQLERSKYFPSDTNVHFVQIIDRYNIKLIVWERGSGASLACGTGACACLIISALLNLTKDSSQVKLPGGILNISWPEKTGSVKMTGPAEFVYSGIYRDSYREAL